MRHKGFNDSGNIYWENPNKMIAETCRMIALSKCLKKFGVNHLNKRFLILLGLYWFTAGIAVGILSVIIGVQWSG